MKLLTVLGCTEFKRSATDTKCAPCPGNVSSGLELEKSVLLPSGMLGLEHTAVEQAYLPAPSVSQSLSVAGERRPPKEHNDNRPSAL
jgi:hypothetical protein